MKTSPRDKSLGAQMSIVLHLLRKKNQDAISKAGYNITMEQMAVLEMLEYNGNMNMTELSVALWKQNANITRIVDILEKKEFVKRIADKNDRRTFIITITDEGKTVISNCLPIVIQANKDSIACISKEEEKNILNSFKKIINHIK